jgi:transketolase
MVYHAKSGHIGGGLGAADLLTVMYYKYLNHRPEDPHWPERDRFILSNGHICPILYAILADRGYFPKEELRTLRKLGSMLQGHPSIIKGTPGIELSGGSLGNGHSFALGQALAARVTGRNYRVYCMVGDGDCQEGQTWEAAEAAAHYKVDNLTVLVDYNRCQIDGPTDEVMSMGDLPGKWRAFGWHVIEVDGHDYGQIVAAFDAALATRGKPTVIVGYTIIGKGVSYMEVDYHWHHGAPNDEEFRQAMAELDAAIAAAGE